MIKLAYICTHMKVIYMHTHKFCFEILKFCIFYARQDRVSNLAYTHERTSYRTLATVSYHTQRLVGEFEKDRAGMSMTKRKKEK